jgi:hypothetical protein
MAFEQPAAAEKFSPRDHPEWVGKLLIIYPLSVETVVFKRPDGSDDPSKIVTADVAFVDLIDPATGKPTVLLGARIGGKALVPQIEPYVQKHNTAAAGRLRQLPAQGQKSGAFVLDNYSDADGPALSAFDATPWRQQVQQPAATPMNAVAAAAPAAVPATAYAPASPAAPWFATPDGSALLAKLVTNGVANAAQLPFETAQMIGQGLPG